MHLPKLKEHYSIFMTSQSFGQVYNVVFTVSRTAVSRQTKNIYEECNKYLSFGEKKPEWFSNKQCAAQYEHLLKNVPPRRKKRTERTPDQGGASESPAEILQQTSRHGNFIFK